MSKSEMNLFKKYKPDKGYTRLIESGEMGNQLNSWTIKVVVRVFWLGINPWTHWYPQSRCA